MRVRAIVHVFLSWCFFALETRVRPCFFYIHLFIYSFIVSKCVYKHAYTQHIRRGNVAFDSKSDLAKEAASCNAQVYVVRGFITLYGEQVCSFLFFFQFIID